MSGSVRMNSPMDYNDIEGFKLGLILALETKLTRYFLIAQMY
jgi:hypothetical protein